MLILQQCTAVDFSGMSNNFSLILTKKRIKMITRNEKAKGLWWRLLATLPVLALLMIANTKVAAQEKKTENVFTIQFGDFELFNDDGTQMQLKDTVVYYEDGTYTKLESSEAVDPFTGELRKTFTVKNYTAEGMPNPNIDFTIREVEKHGDTMMYSMDPFTISGDIVDRLKNKIMTDEDIDIEVTEVTHVDNDTVFQIVEQMPQFPGGEKAMMKYVSENIKYPQEARDKDIDGRVFVSFVVEKDGSIGEVKVMRGIGGGCDEEAARVISAMPKWEPGKQKGKPVRVSYMMPITFKLSDGQPKQPIKKSNESKADMKPDKNGVYQLVEEMPQFPRGEAAMMEYVAQNVVYPQEAREKGISGRVFVSFIVEKDGSISNVELKRGIGGGCDEEAVRVISAMPRWKPGKMKGEPVRVNYMMPINFRLQ